MKKGLFISGTDTGVGKTFVTSGILTALRRMGMNVCPMKPVETGCRLRKGVLVPGDVLKLLKSSGLNEGIDAVNPYRFSAPLSPLAAAEVEGSAVRKGRIISVYNKLCKKYDRVLIEGAGGLMVPISKRYLMVDLVKDMGVPLVIVARRGLGTINHTLLSVEAARSRGIEVKGVILNDSAGGKRDASVRSNPDMISKTGGVDILGEIPYFALPENGKLTKLFNAITERIIT